MMYHNGIDKSCVEDCFGWLCASTLCSALLHTVQLRPDGNLRHLHDNQ